MSRWPNARDRWKCLVPSRLMQERLFLDGKILADFVAYLQKEQQPQLAAQLWLLAAARFSLDPSELDVEAAMQLTSKLEKPWESYLQAPEGYGSFCDVQARMADRARTGQLLRSLSVVVNRQSSSSSVPDNPMVSGGQIVDKGNLMYEFTVSAMIGIRVAVACQSLFDSVGLSTMGVQTAADVESFWRTYFPQLSFLDCLQNTCVVYEVPPEGTAYSPPTKELTAGRLKDAYTIEDYCPQLFAQVRRLSGISNEQFFDSICRPDVELVEFQTNSKSGEFFFFSHDGRFLLKTITRREAEVLIRMLPDMIARFEGAPHSLLCRYLGLYRIKQAAEEFDLLFSVMASVTQNCHPVHLAYDLKGSTKGRHAAAGEHVKKDVNFRREVGALWLNPGVAEQLVRTHAEDLAILRRHSVLDYSVLLHAFDSRATAAGALFRQHSRGLRAQTPSVGSTTVRLATGHIPVRDGSLVPLLVPSSVGNAGPRSRSSNEPAPLWKPAEGIWSSDGRYLYTIGLIDLLIPYYWKKKMEAAGYEVMYCGSTGGASAVAPDAYADRQIEMMEKICLAREPPSSGAQDGEAIPTWTCPCFRLMPGRRRDLRQSDGETTDADSSEDDDDEDDDASSRA